jgi:hypothetical protein
MAATGRIRIDEESALKSMPVTAEAILRSAQALRPILPEKFYGRFILIFEDGRPIRWETLQSGKL